MAATKFYIVGNIDQNTVAAVLSLQMQLVAPKTDPNTIPPTELIVYINSLGGDIGSSIACYNILRSISLPVTTHNMGEVSSAANIIYLGGSRRLTCRHSYFRHHGSFYAVSGTSHRVVYEDVLETLKISEKIMSEIIVERTGLSATDVETYFHAPAIIDPAEAVKLGIAHAIQEIA
jgi:ATP-dependent Clp protease protease subunit